ncbi:DUF3237 family protein [Microlunatus ginsengisoli]|uniref:Uncharacterized protein n=1 Tax=Microlunatus ginsengisoli TaxID=363863 RepID=A0ABP7AA01_9ACTN
MVRLTHNGLKIWYATPDAPAPDGTLEQRQGVSVTVGVRPANPSNAVSVRYRVDGQVGQSISALLVANDFQQQTQYFRATFPTFWSGDSVEYMPIVSCNGRRAPDPETASAFPTRFRLSQESAAVPASRPAERTAERRPEFAARLEHLAHVRVELAREPELFGETPAGFIINWPPVSGTVDGPALHASVVPGGVHQTAVRPDGIGILTVTVTIETHDRILIAEHASATVDFGEDWRSWLPVRKWRPTLPVRSAIRMVSSEPRYGWLNRLQCLGIGEARLYEYLYAYDLYAVH